MKTKRIISLALSLILLFALSVTAFAAQPPAAEPYYTGTVSVSADLSIGAFGKAECDSTVSLRSGYTANLTMNLKQLDGITWTTFKSWDTSGSLNLSLNKSWYLLSGYYYMVETVAEVYDSNGNYVETATVTSNAVRYG